MSESNAGTELLYTVAVERPIRKEGEVRQREGECASSLSYWMCVCPGVSGSASPRDRPSQCIGQKKVEHFPLVAGLMLILCFAMNDNGPI